MTKYQIKTINITKSACIVALLTIVYLLTGLFKIGESTLQLTDGIFIWLCLLLPNELTMLFVAIIYPIIIESISGNIVFILISIFIHVGMYYILKIKTINKSLKIILASLMVFLYIPFQYILFIDNASINSILLKETIIDLIQLLFTVSFAFILVYKRNIKSSIYKILNNNKRLDSDI